MKAQIPPVEKIETVIGPTASFRGEIRSDGSIRIDGVYDGSIETAGNLIIGEQAKIMADISAHHVSVAGAVKGDIQANRVEVLETGCIWGDLTVNAFTLDDGGFVSGQVSMHTDMSPPMLEAPKKKTKADSEPIEGEIVGEEE
ncbi:MAG: polymer-forming cytoskeletal protein [Anaerolineae bacterium]|nr:MAG: polymer-forming cytoskeletal protein [Anaerolineae bacterium]